MASLKETRVMIDNVNNSQNSCFIMQISKLCKRIRLHLLFLWTLREHCFRWWCSKLCRRWQLVWTSSILSWRCQCFSALMDLPFSHTVLCTFRFHPIPVAAQGHLDFYRLRSKKQELRKRVYDESEIDNCYNCHVNKIL